MRLIKQKLGRQQAWGMADASVNTIWLDPRLRGRRRLTITIHELMHLLYPNETEENVTHAGELLARVLWRENWRHVDSDKT